MDTISPEVKAIGAVNTIKANNGKLEGYNTDAYGFINAIKRKMDLKLVRGNTAIVFGTGGAARAIVWSLINIGFRVVVVYREPESFRTQNFKRDFINKVSFVTYSKLTPNNFKESILLCNATSAGMYPNKDEAPINLNLFNQINLSEVVVFDAIFNPITTKLQKWAKDRGATLTYGIDMMIYQGVVAFEYWTGKKVDEKIAQKAFNILIKNK